MSNDTPDLPGDPGDEPTPASSPAPTHKDSTTGPTGAGSTDDGTERDDFESLLASRLHAAAGTVTGDGVTREGVADHQAVRSARRRRRHAGVVVAAAAAVVALGVGITVAASADTPPTGLATEGGASAETSVGPASTEVPEPPEEGCVDNEWGGLDCWATTSMPDGPGDDDPAGSEPIGSLPPPPTAEDQPIGSLPPPPSTAPTTTEDLPIGSLPPPPSDSAVPAPTPPMSAAAAETAVLTILQTLLDGGDARAHLLDDDIVIPTLESMVPIGGGLVAEPVAGYDWNRIGEGVTPFGGGSPCAWTADTVLCSVQARLPGGPAVAMVPVVIAGPNGPVMTVLYRL